MAASDWIKVRTVLPTDGRLKIVSRKCHVSTVTALGALVTLWCLADSHASEDGQLFGYTADDIDVLVTIPGFCISLPADWIDASGEFVKLPDYQEHNGTTGKTRAQDSKRQKRHRAATDASRTERDEKRTRGEESREEESQKPSSSGDDAGAVLRFTQAERLAQVTDDAIAAYNAILTAPNGVLPVVTSAGREKRQGEVKRCLRVVKRICQEQYGSTVVTPAFWKAYFDEVARDDFKAGRQVGGRGHEGWKPGFEYLTREATVLEVFERAMSEVG